MNQGNKFARALALSTALSVVALGATTTSAEALDPGKGQSAEKSSGKSQGKANGHDKKSAPKEKSGQGNSGKSDDNGHSQGSGNGQGPKDKGGKDKGPAEPGTTATDAKGPQDKGDKDKGGKDKGGKGGDPAGNNGTVKVTPPGQEDGIPQNNPHLPCVFDVEWYGFDEGDDIISKVTFEAWSPTRYPMTVDGPAEVFVGADPASGAGVGTDEDGTDADNGFDGEATYRLTFDGEPHPKQGYHVKLTVNTPGSQGADAKHKVFWVEECGQPVPPVEPPVVEPPVEEPPVEEPETPDTEGEQGNEEETDDETDDESDVEVLGEQGTDAPVNGAQGGETLPTAVDAGLQAVKWVVSPTPTPLYVAIFGAILVGLGLLVRRRFN